MSMSDPFGAGLGGPGMWDPMPLTPPVRPPTETEQGQLIWSRPEAAPAAPEKRSKSRPAPGSSAAKQQGSPPTKGRPVKKATTGRPAKKAAQKSGTRGGTKRKTAKKKPAKPIKTRAARARVVKRKKSAAKRR